MRPTTFLWVASGFCCGVGLGATTGCFRACADDPQLTSGTYSISEVRPASEEGTSEAWLNVPLAEGGVAIYTEWEELRLVYTPPSGVETHVVFGL